MYDRIKGYLLTSIIYPGQKIPVGEIVKKLGIGLTPMREVLFQLAVEGLLSYEKNRGFFVPGINLEEAQALYEVRELLEPYMAAKAARLITKVQLEMLGKLLNQYKPKPSEQYSRSRLQIDRAFHAEIMRIGDNKRLANIVNQVFDQLIMRRKLEDLPPQRPHVAYEEHGRIYKYLEKRDSKGASRVMRAHIRSARKAVLGDLERKYMQFFPVLSSSTK